MKHLNLLQHHLTLEAVINIINEQIDITRNTRKKKRPAPVRSMIQIVRPRPSVPVVEVRPTKMIAGSPISRPTSPVSGVSSLTTSRPIPRITAESTRPRRRGGRY